MMRETSGDPDNPINPSESQGYCAFAFEKNVIALGAKSVVFSEESEALSRAAGDEHLPRGKTLRLMVDRLRSGVVSMTVTQQSIHIKTQ